jgi:hypothetical protein
LGPSEPEPHQRYGSGSTEMIQLLLRNTAENAFPYKENSSVVEPHHFYSALTSASTLRLYIPSQLCQSKQKLTKGLVQFFSISNYLNWYKIEWTT